MDKLKIQTASSKNFPAWKRIDCANHVCLSKQSNSNWSRHFGPAQNSRCLEQEFSFTKENRPCKPCVPNKTNWFLNDEEYLDKFKIPSASSKKIHHKRKQAVQTMCAKWNYLQSNCPRIFGQAQNSKCLEQQISITKEKRHARLANETICNPIVQE